MQRFLDGLGRSTLDLMVVGLSHKPDLLRNARGRYFGTPIYNWIYLADLNLWHVTLSEYCIRKKVDSESIWKTEMHIT